ncbi:unnamed protein product [Clonostachys rosea]|uniref:MYND-type domain-containing protein n=1 Tax=Bionectria ochroleuca TaxID=29856 RepID=A0ABY6UBZ7_BIOOC|nr:unnamed protein product [Clonostachys rosea]
MPSSVNNTPGLRPKACPICSSQTGLIHCASCEVLDYCGSRHQISHKQQHYPTCILIKYTRMALDNEERKIRTQFEEDDINPLDASAEYFPSLRNAHPYLSTRLRLVNLLLDHFGAVGGYTHVIRAALDHVLEMIRLDPSDKLYISNIIPALYIRLGMDQEAYNFLDWWFATSNGPFSQWTSMDLPFLDPDYQQKDILAPLEDSWDSVGAFSLNQWVAVLLIKMKVLLDLRAMQNARRAFHGVIPTELIDIIRMKLSVTPAASQNRVAQADFEETASMIATIKNEVRGIYHAITDYNPHIWSMMSEDDILAMTNRHFDNSRSSFQPGSHLESCIALRYNFPAWAETPGAVQAIEYLNMAQSTS